MDEGNPNTTEQLNSSQLCPSVSLGATSTFFDLTLSSLGLAVVFRHLWLVLQAKKIEFLQLNLIVFHTLNNIGLLLDLLISYTSPKSLVHTRVVLLGFVLTGGSLILCCICIERYIAVIHPIQYQQLKTKRIKEIGSAATWIITLFFPQCWNNDICLTFKLIASIFLMSVLVMIWCNSHILQALRKSGPGRDEMHPIKVKAFNRVFMISVIVLMFYLPAAVTAVILAVCDEMGQTVCLLIPLCILLCSCSSIAHSVFKLFVKGHLWCTENLLVNCKI